MIIAHCPFCGCARNGGNSPSAFFSCEKCGWISALANRPCQQPENWDLSIDVGMVLRDRYRLDQFLGRGVQGITFRAEHLFINHPCVVKLLPHPVRDTRDRFVQQLRAEAHSGFKVISPHVVRIIDGDVIDGLWFFVMEFIEGGNLADLIQEKHRIPWEQVAQIGLEAASGLVAIHQANLVHGDIKPSNILIGQDGKVRIGDLGVASTISGMLDSRETGGVPSGTIGYAAPELFSGESSPDPRIDLYALGVTLYELVHGRMPFPASNPLRMLVDVQNRRAIWPADSRNDVPASMIATILSLLEFDPKRRICSAAEVCDRLAAELPNRPQLVSTVQHEIGTPHGVVIPSFQNDSAKPSEEWLAIALSDHLARALWQQYGLYLVDRDEHARLQARLTSDNRTNHSAGIEAARLLGAATIIHGAFERRDDILRLKVAFTPTSGDVSPASLAFEGPMTALVDLQSRLLTSVAQSIGAVVASERSQSLDMAPPSPTAQEQLAEAKRFYLRGDYQKAINACQCALSTDPNLAEAIGLAGACQSKMGHYGEADRLHARQLEIAGRLNDARLLLESHASVGAMNYFRGNYEAALQSYHTALDIAKKSSLSSEMGKVSNNLGFTLYQLNRRSDAEAAYRLAIETHKANGALISLIGPYNGLGNVLRDQGRVLDAISYHRRALALAQESDDQVNAGICYVYLGKCAGLQNRLADAKQDFASALNLLEDTSFWNGLARVYDSMAELNMRLGDWAEADRCADKKIDLARQHANARMEAGAWRQKAKALEMGGQLADAENCIDRARLLESPDDAPRAVTDGTSQRSVACSRC